MTYDYEYLKKCIMEMTGIDLNSYKEKQMKRRIDSLIKRQGIDSYQEFVDLLKRDRKVFEEFISYLTINVSEFYRNPEQWEYLEKQIIPELMNRFGNRLKIWSAACSTGDEPYSLVMVFSKFLPLNQIKIYATDIDKQILAKAKVGLYNEKSIAGVPEEFKKKYFDKIGNSYQIKQCIKDCVEFSEQNLLENKFLKDCNFIVCRNVLIYFTEEAKDSIFRKFNASLKQKGILFIGSTEQIVNYHEIGFARKNSFFYEKIGEAKA
ncbi:MAG: CheR family methyltransferase [Lachnospiraceae bacterium]